MDVKWRKSSYSGGNGGNCVEVGNCVGARPVMVRDTKDQRGPVLAFTGPAWRNFAERVKRNPTA
jgi:hypothetical protein